MGRKPAGRYPFRTLITRYLEERAPFFADGTMRRKERNLRWFAQAFEGLKSDENIPTHNPTAFTEREIGAFLQWMKARRGRWGRGLDPSTQKKYLQDLEDFLIWCGNGIIEQMRRSRRYRLPKATDKEITTLTEVELAQIRQGAAAIGGWKGKVARFIAAFYPATGLRRRELRLAHLQDLDLANWRLFVRMPKGEGSWGKRTEVLILPQGRDALLAFLEEREAYLAIREAADAEQLIPYFRRGSLKPEFWSDGMWGKLKAEIERETGVRFSLKDFRSTFAQMCKDRGASIEAVSRALRHKTTRTTELYYARIKADDAFDELERIWVSSGMELVSPTAELHPKKDSREDGEMEIGKP